MKYYTVDLTINKVTGIDALKWSMITTSAEKLSSINIYITLPYYFYFVLNILVFFKTLKSANVYIVSLLSLHVY